MAWRCSGKSSAELIANLVEAKLITSERVAESMKNVDRANYCLRPNKAYEDSPQSLGHDATISAPHAHACENLLPFLSPGQSVLDVGSGSGYLLGIFHQLISPGGHVVGIDHIPELTEMSLRNLQADGKESALQNGLIKVITGDGRKGWLEGAPYSAIHVGAAAPTMPQALIDQLASPGKIFIPIGTNSQAIFEVNKDEHGIVTQTRLFGVRYVPLCDRKDT